jgi:hypothetical protein
LFPKELRSFATAKSNESVMQKCGESKVHNETKLKRSTVGFRKKLEFITVHHPPVNSERNSLKEVWNNAVCQEDRAADRQICFHCCKCS